MLLSINILCLNYGNINEAKKKSFCNCAEEQYKESTQILDGTLIIAPNFHIKVTLSEN